MKLVIYTDGGSWNNQLPKERCAACAWSMFFVDGTGKTHTKTGTAYLGRNTNQYAELAAIYEALRDIKIDARFDGMSIEWHTDSKYALGLIVGTDHAKANAGLVSGIKQIIQQRKFDVTGIYTSDVDTGILACHSMVQSCIEMHQ